eukprot:CAMPEP_0184326814 /NCGR_PEP_ID=MMETSP1049-20130417/142753_1 /TAXON_ID=77928 /ORGANISM="Proteomonas sulcata, Strain CCMP704" /LENGTH=366 /DNA_ID=CAMNT_0026649029 /DNA_START=1 /DNA_END=1101 /DNA_ORIENTATION=-
MQVEFPAWIQIHIQDGIPNISKMQVAATEEPIVKFKLEMSSLTFLPTLFKSLIDSTVRTMVNSLVLLPQKKLIISSDVDPPSLSPDEKRSVGILSVKLLQAEDLVDPDSWGTCDPFVALRLGSQRKDTKTVPNTRNPVFNEYFQFLVQEEQGDLLELELGDRDLFKTDTLGFLVLRVSEMVRVKGFVQSWYPLEEGQGGRVELALAYSRFVSHDGPKVAALGADITVTSLPARKQGAKTVTPQEVEASVLSGKVEGFKGKLIVKVEGCSNIPKSDLLGSCEPYVKVSCGHDVKRTAILQGTSDPQWNQSLVFTLDGPLHSVFFNLKNHKTLGRAKHLGVARVDLTRRRKFTTKKEPRPRVLQPQEP